MARIVEFVIILLASSCFVTLHATGWNYNETSAEGPEHWGEHYPTCGGSVQSPIDVIVNDLRAENVTSMVFTGYETAVSGHFTLVNNGHSAEVDVHSTNIRISGGGLGATYTLEQFHFHWGEDSHTGSEHVVNGKPHPMEIHLVHYNSDKYTSVSDASSHTNDSTALAVLGVFVDESSDTMRLATELGNLANSLPSISHEGDETEIESFALDEVMPCDRSMYRYNGSLTTPGCNEVVIWSVFTQPIYLTTDQIAKFRELYSNPTGEPDAKLTHNYRPVQLLNNRTVYQYIDYTASAHCSAPGFHRHRPLASACFSMAAIVAVTLVAKLF